MNQEKMFFTADTHFGHAAMPERWRRDLFDVQTHDDTLLANWNNVVPADGHVFILGDFSFAGSARTAEVIGSLNGRKYLVEGNHDRGLSKWVRDLFEWVKPYHEHKVRLDGMPVRLVMSHYAFRHWNNQAHGSLMLHGHAHGNLPRQPRQLDVGVDVAKVLLGQYRPFRLQEVLNVLRREPITWEDHHIPK